MRRLAGTITLVAATSVVLFAAQPAYASSGTENGRIAFRRALGPHTAAIFTINPDGSHERQLTYPHHVWTTEPSWSPSGRWIVYDIWLHGDEAIERLAKMRANGSDKVRLDPDCRIPCLSDQFPAWSPQGNLIAFGRAFGPGHDVSENVYVIFTMSTDGSDERQVTQIGVDLTTEQPFWDTDPSWSPTGTRLAFQRTRLRDNLHAIFTVRLDGTKEHRITPWSLDAASPEWSRRGGWIGFRTHESSDSKGDIGLVRPTGKRLHLITSGNGKWGLLAISPNGRQVAASINDDIYRMRIDGSHAHLVVGTPRGEGIPAWGPRRQ